MMNRTNINMKWCKLLILASVLVSLLHSPEPAQALSQLKVHGKTAIVVIDDFGNTQKAQKK